MNQEITAQLTQLRAAMERLREALAAEPTQLNKDAAIQRFEFTFELFWKTLKTYALNQGLEVKSPKDAFRIAAQLDLISDPQQFFDYLQSRNLSTHTYSQEQAEAIYQTIKSFPDAVSAVLAKMAADH